MKYRHGERIALIGLNCEQPINETNQSYVKMNDNKLSRVTPSARAYIEDHSLNYHDDEFEGSCKLLGSGFFANVYRVKHSHSGLIMALKVPKNTESMNRFMKEVRLLKSLYHDNILKFYGTCVFNGLFGCLTEYLDSGNLSNLIEKCGPSLDWSTGVNIVHDISQGLGYLHQQSIVHRDLSSENILLQRDYDLDSISSPSNVKYRAVIADFGLFLNLKQIGSDQISTVGNPFYTAPENLKNQSPYNYFSDVFSFGMILCEIITGLKNDPNNISRTNNYGLDYKKLKVKKDCPKWLQGLTCDCCMVYVSNRPNMKRACEIIVENKKYIKLWKSVQFKEEFGSKLSSSWDGMKLRMMSARYQTTEDKEGDDAAYLNGIKMSTLLPICRYNSVDSFINPRIVNMHKALNDPGYVDTPLIVSMMKLDPRFRSPIIQHLSKKLSRCSSESDLLLLITPKKCNPKVDVFFLDEYSHTNFDNSSFVSSPITTSKYTRQDKC